MQLFHSPNSPYVRIVSVTAHELGLSNQIELVPTDVWQDDNLVIEQNPLGQIPTLICDDGRVLYDSGVICEYLDAEFGDGSMLPGDRAARWPVMKLRALAYGLLNGAIIRAMELRRRPEELRWNKLIDRQVLVMGRVYNELERQANGFPKQLDLAQITLGCALGYVDLRCPGDNWRNHRPNLAEWYRTIESRDSFIETAPPGVLA